MAELPSTNTAEIDIVRQIAHSEADRPVFMLNLNKYKAEAAFPHGQLYLDYMTALDRLLSDVGARIDWRTTVHGQIVGIQTLDEAIGIWYPSHQAFLNLMSAPASAENMRLRALAIEHADLHRCDIC